MMQRRRTPESYAREFDTVTLGNLILNTESELRWQARKLKSLRAAVPLRRQLENESARATWTKQEVARLNPPRKRKRK